MVDMTVPLASIALASPNTTLLYRPWLEFSWTSSDERESWDRMRVFGESVPAGASEHRLGLLYPRLARNYVFFYPRAFVRENGQAVLAPDFTETSSYQIPHRVRVRFGQAGLPIKFRTNYTDTIYDATIKLVPGVPPRYYIVQYNDDVASMVLDTAQYEFDITTTERQRAYMVEINGVNHAILLVPGLPSATSIQGITLNYDLAIQFATTLSGWPTTGERLVLVFYIPVQYT